MCKLPINILLIDNDPENCREVKRVLSGSADGPEFRVKSVGTLSEGAETLATSCFDIILLDVHLPDSDGVETLDKIRGLNHKIPIVVLRMPDDEISIQAIKRVAEDYLVKGELLRDVLVRVIHHAIELKAMKTSLDAMGEKLRETHRENEGLLKAITSILISIDENNRIVQWNATAEKIFGIDKSEACGQTLQQCDIKWEWDRIDKAIDLCRTHGEPIPVDDLQVTRADGTEGFLGLTINPITKDNEKQSDILLFGADVTKRKILESQLTEARKLESIGQLASGIAHEINTPTQYVGDNTQFLKESFEDIMTLLEQYGQLVSAVENGNAGSEMLSEMAKAFEEADVGYLAKEIPHAIQQSLDGIGRITGIVQSMKKFAHPDSESKTIIDINEAIESTLIVTRNEWKYVADMKTDFASDLPKVPCFPGEFNQVILNVIINAAHAISNVTAGGADGRGVITATTRADGAWVEIRISDTGTGIPDEIKQRVFEPFFTTKATGKGSGQGLAISRSVIVDKHGGELDFETEVSKGTTFIIRLPIVDETTTKKLEDSCNSNV